MRLPLLVSAVFLPSLAAAAPSRPVTTPAAVTVYLERNGAIVDRSNFRGSSVREAEIPAFAGTDRTWQSLVSCVRRKFSAFSIDVVDQKPSRGPYITAVVGGSAELLGYDPEHVAGLGVSSTEIERDAVVHVFSETIGDEWVDALCDTALHEVGHALGLDHSMQCGDIMSYPRKECRANTNLHIVDAEARCGEYEERSCQQGGEMQNTYQRLASLVGLRSAPVTPETFAEPELYTPEPYTEPAPVTDPFADADYGVTPDPDGSIFGFEPQPQDPYTDPFAGSPFTSMEPATEHRCEPRTKTTRTKPSTRRQRWGRRYIYRQYSY